MQVLADCFRIYFVKLAPLFLFFLALFFLFHPPHSLLTAFLRHQMTSSPAPGPVHGTASDPLRFPRFGGVSLVEQACLSHSTFPYLCVRQQLLGTHRFCKSHRHVHG